MTSDLLMRGVAAGALHVPCNFTPRDLRTLVPFGDVGVGVWRSGLSPRVTDHLLELGHECIHVSGCIG